MFLGTKYKVITMCGSSRFKDDFIREARRLNLAGYIVMSLCVFGHVDDEYNEAITPATKKMLDEMHLQKIDMCDIVFVVNKDGYIGESTEKEIAYAINQGKHIQYMEND